MTVRELIAGLLAKVAGLGAAAKAAVGTGLLTATVATAGAAGVLPDPVQHAVAGAVNASTPLEIPDPGPSRVVATESVAAVGGTDGSTTTTSTTLARHKGDDADDADEARTRADDAGTGTGTKADNHGACVSAVARDKTAEVDGNHGKAVSAVAKTDCGKATSTTSTSSTSTTVGGTTTTSTPVGRAASSSGKGEDGEGGGKPGNGKADSGKGGSGRP